MVKRYLILLLCLFLLLPIPAKADYLVGGAANYLFSIDPDLGSSDTTVSSQNAVKSYVDNHFCPANGYLITTQNVPALTNGTNLGGLSSGLLKMSVSGGVATLSTAVEGTDYVTSCPASPTYASLSSHYLMLQNDATLPNSFNVGSLSTGLLKITVSGGVAVPSIAVDGTDYLSTASIGSSFQAISANLTYLAGFTPSNDVKVILNAANNADIKSALGYHTAGDAITGTFTGNLIGNVTGNASTAAALATNPTNCAAGYAPLGIDVSGNAEGCWQPIASNANLSSLSALSYSSASFVKMMGANTFALDTTLYQPLLINPITGTGTANYWAYFSGSTSLSGMQVTASKVVCTNSSGLPVACTNLTDVVPLTGSSTLGSWVSGAGTVASTDTYLAALQKINGNVAGITLSSLGAQAAFTSQTANYFYAAPNGSSGVPGFRALMAADIPALPYDASGAAAARQANLSLVAGTYTNGYLCSYASSGTLLNCNTNPSSFISGTLVTTLGNPGSDTNIPSEKAVRAAISSAGGGTIGGSTGSTTNAIITANGTGGSTIQATPATVDSSGNINIPTGTSYKINGTGLAASDVSAIPTSAKGAASGVASLDSNSLVVQNPTNATATPTASKIPIADASGTLNSWVTASASRQGDFKNLSLSATGSSVNTTITADQIVVQTSTYASVLLNSISLTIATSTSGANGLDTGSIAYSTWYSVWIIYNSTTMTAAGLLSTNSTSPTLPSGYTYYARVGWIKTQSSTNYYPLSFIQRGREARYKVVTSSNVTGFPSLGTGSSGSCTVPTWTSLSTANYIPTTAAAIWIVTSIGAGSYGVMVAPSNAYGAYNSTSNPPPYYAQAGSYGVYQGKIILESSTIYWASGTSNAYFFCLGWEDNL